MNRHHARFPKGTWMRLQSPATLRALIDQRGYSIDRQARYSGCSKSFISHLLAGRKTTCTPALALRIAEALDVPLEVLFVPSVSPNGGPSVTQKRIAS